MAGSDLNDAPLDLKLGEVAQILGVSPGTVRRWTDRGYLKFYVTPGGHRRYSKTDVDEFLLKMRKAS
jgi:excisionase family DNA binding protein